jgi:hypothetical protein
MITEDEADQIRIREVVENWVLFRDSGDWDAFRSVWHPDGWMTATWFQGPADEFVDVSRAGFEAGVNLMHVLGGFTCRTKADRAIAQTKMTIMQRATVDGVLVDVSCHGRFYDFFARREGKWRIVRRQPIYEKDRMDPVDPAAFLALDAAALAAFPAGYRHLAYLQTKAGYDVMNGLPGLRGVEVELLYREGEEWLAGSTAPGLPLSNRGS